MKRYLTIISLNAIAASTVAAQTIPWKAPTLRIVDSVRIDSEKEELYGQPVMALRGDGSIAIMGKGYHLTYFDSTGRRRWTRTLRNQIGTVDALGWRGDSIYIFDNFGDQVVAVGSNGGVGGSVDWPDYVRPKWKDRLRMPAYGAIDVMASTSDGSLVGTPRNPHRLAVYGSTARLDPSRVPVVRIDGDGIVQSFLGTVVNAAKGDVWSVLPDGRLIVFHPRKDSVDFIGISPSGDTVFSRVMPNVRAIMGSVGGPDGTVWVTSSMGGTTFVHTAFDANGVTIGRFELPNSFRLRAGDARHVWVIDTQGQAKPITRFTVRPKP